MFQIIKKLHIDYYDYIYFFAMVIYMAFMTGETRVMLGGMEKNIVAFCIPIVLTVILLYKHPLAFNNSNFKIIIGVLLVWSFVQIMVKHQYTPKSFANYLYYLYAITIAYIHVRIYKRKMFYLYEDVMVKLSLLSLIIWIFTNIAPGLAMQVASLFPKTSHGYNFLYLIHWISPYGRHVTYGLTRNAGCSWEPGRFAIMVCLALLINFYRKGTSFKNNKNGIVLLLSLLTTMSTTGYVLGFVLYAYMYIKGIKHVIIFTIIGIPIFYLAYQLEFVGEKIESKMKVEETVEHIEETYSWSEQNADGTLAYSMDRFPSMVFEFENFIHDPIIGYGANVLDSYFMRTRTKMIGFTGGLVTMLSKFGIIFGGFLLYILFLSSPRISSVLHSKKKYGILICMVLSMVSYPLIWFPVYTAFWFYGFFLYDETKILNIWRKLRLQ